MIPPERDAMRKRLKKIRDLPSNNRSKILSNFHAKQEFFKPALAKIFPR
jgi:hypothetical protein